MNDASAADGMAELADGAVGYFCRDSNDLTKASEQSHPTPSTIMVGLFSTEPETERSLSEGEGDT